jgi:hypothetical protein
VRRLLIVILLLIALAIVFIPPIAAGWHIGYNAATDEVCENRVGIQWCGDNGERAAAQAAQEQANEEAAGERREP